MKRPLPKSALRRITAVAYPGLAGSLAPVPEFDTYFVAQP
jgi:hypothetical protein